MKASREAFHEAVAPVLADLDRDHPSLLRVAEEPVDSRCNAFVWDSTGAGTGISVSDAHEGPDSIAEAAGQVQEAAVEALWREGKSTSWPPCPRHPETHPLAAAVRRGAAVWVCQATGQMIAIIGSSVRT